MMHPSAWNSTQQQYDVDEIGTNHHHTGSTTNGCSYRRRIYDITNTPSVNSSRTARSEDSYSTGSHASIDTAATATNDLPHRPQHCDVSPTCNTTTTTAVVAAPANVAIVNATTINAKTKKPWHHPRPPISPTSMPLCFWIWTSATTTTGITANNRIHYRNNKRQQNKASSNATSNSNINKLSYVTSMTILLTMMGCAMFTLHQLQLLYHIYVNSDYQYHQEQQLQSYSDLLLYSSSTASTLRHRTNQQQEKVQNELGLLINPLISHQHHAYSRQLLGKNSITMKDMDNKDDGSSSTTSSTTSGATTVTINSNRYYNLPVTTASSNNDQRIPNTGSNSYELTRSCTSPEKHVPWIFGDQFADASFSSTGSSLMNMYTRSCSNNRSKTIVQSQTSQSICGYCDIENMEEDMLSSNQASSERANNSRKKRNKSFVQYLYKLSQEIKETKGQECNKLLVYGVAFGNTYVNWLVRNEADDPTQEKNFKLSSDYVQQLLHIHGKCFITFVVQESLNDYNVTPAVPLPEEYDGSVQQPPQRYGYYSNDGLQLLIPIAKKDLPYKNMRRNTKIFKMFGPSYIFPWVQRVVWQDAKLIVAHATTKPILPQNYYEYFFNTIDFISSSSSSTGGGSSVCASFMGIPFHRNTMGKQGFEQLSSVQFAPHCNAIIEASIKRPTISDDLNSVQYQCSIYQNLTQQALAQDRRQQTGSNLTSSSSMNRHILETSANAPPSSTGNILLDQGMIDSAFIVWDLRTERCQNFVDTISCTWFDEIHCYSDRDQVSFPYVFWKMGLQEITQQQQQPLSLSLQQNSQIVDEVVIGLPSPETHHRLFAHYSTPTQPLVHITKSSCHWYFNNLKECDLTRNDPLPVLQKTKYWPKILRPPRFLRKFVGYDPLLYSDRPVYVRPKQSATPNAYKIAIIVVGSFHRYIFQSSMQRLIEPLTRQGNYVDYYVSMSMNKAPAYRADQGYMNHLVNDPIFDQYMVDNGINSGRSLTNGTDESIIQARIKKVIEQHVQVAGGNLRYISFQEDVDVNKNEQVQARRARAKQLYPNEDPDLRFPLFDIREEAKNRTANANRNMLHLFYNIQNVYQRMIARENDVRVKYDYVFFLRDDTMWLDNFNFQALLESTTLSEDRNRSSTIGNIGARSSNRKDSIQNTSINDVVRNIDLYVPSCDARIPSMHPAEINDHIAIVKRGQADIFGMYFDELFRTDYDQCASRLDDAIRYGKSYSNKDPNVSPQRGCNSEMILQYILETKNVTIAKVGQGNIPFQRMALVGFRKPEQQQHNISTTRTTASIPSVHTCFHKFCQSYSNPLFIHPGLKKCKDLMIL